MGISYSAVKTLIPEAWELGKDYYGLTELFPPCAHEMKIPGWERPPLKYLKFLVGSSYIVGNTVFRVTDVYSSADQMIEKAKSFGRPFYEYQENDLRGFYAWAGDDPLQFIADFDELLARGAKAEYTLCASPKKYRYADRENTDEK